MKKIIIGCVLTVISKFGFSQENPMKMLVGKDKEYVIQYLTNLNNQIPNPYSKIEHDVSNDGELILSNSFAIANENHYKCTDVVFLFHKFSKGDETCVKELIMGHVEYAIDNLDYVKKNFNYLESNNWEKDFSDIWKINATFERQESTYPMFKIEYILKKK